MSADQSTIGNNTLYVISSVGTPSKCLTTPYNPPLPQLVNVQATDCSTISRPDSWFFSQHETGFYLQFLQNGFYMVTKDGSAHESVVASSTVYNFSSIWSVLPSPNTWGYNLCVGGINNTCLTLLNGELVLAGYSDPGNQDWTIQTFSDTHI